ncbi:hypothetical protein SUGI_0662110 [Cryptomeria japonica]|nr:hypothetical protein SUGI_0662110 [Cryptomeria japonica]
MGSSVKGNNNSFDRNDRPPMTCTIFWQIFLIALSGISVSQNLFFIGLAYTSATFTAAIINVLPIVTSVMAIAFRYEKVDIRTKRGQATITGTAICVGGAMIMTLYKGSTISLTGTLVLKLSTWFLGAASLVVCLLFLAAYLTFQVPILKKYPAQKSFIALHCILGSMSSAFTFFVQTYTIKERGPIFPSLFNPLSAIIVAVLELTIFHASLHVGSVVGGVLTIAGLYIALWGKANDKEETRPIEDEVEDGTVETK